MIAHTSGDGIPLIAVHGFSVDHRIMLPLEQMLPQTGWRRVYLDLPWAAGAEDTAAQTPAEVADGVLDEVRTIADGGPFAIIGNSFGGMVARFVAHALADQCVGLATLAGAVEMDRDRRTLPPFQAIIDQPGVRVVAGSDWDAYEGLAVLRTFESFAGFRRYVLPGLQESDSAVLERIEARYSEAYAPEVDGAPPFAAPSLHITGRQDQVVGYEDALALREHYPRGSFVMLDGAGHNLHIEHPEAVGALIRDWLRLAAAHAA